MTDEPAAAKPDETVSSKLGRLVSKHPQLVSSLLLGVAGLIATSIWQYRQQQTQKDQAAAAQKVAETQAANSWKIERTDVLAKNLETLAQAGSASADQRYGVLLSLTRADIIDPELAVSYSLELGKDNTEYMQSVLANTQNKDYQRLLRAYTLSCEERYGTTPAIEACNDKLAPRSQALADLIAQEADAALMAGSGDPGPLVLLRDERRVQADIMPLAGLFETALDNFYDRRAWDELEHLEKLSPGAHLVASLVLSAAHTGEFVSEDEARTLVKFHAEQTRWLTDYLASKSCDAGCKGRLLDVMVSHYEEAQGDFDDAIRHLLESPRAVSGPAIALLHSRLLWCQVDDSDLVPLRDHVLIPAAQDLLTAKDTSARDDIISLLALLPDAGDAEKTLARLPDALKLLRERRDIAQHQRQAPPPSMRKVSFCTPAPAKPGAAPAP